MVTHTSGDLKMIPVTVLRFFHQKSGLIYRRGLKIQEDLLRT